MADNVVVPIYDAGRGFRCWHLPEIYQGPETGRYVPNVNDLVLDWNLGFYKVVAVDLRTGLSRLEAWRPPVETNTITVGDQLLGVDIAACGESFRVYIDTSVNPHTLAVDSRLHIYGSNATSIKIFLGTDLSPQGQVISALYDAAGTFLGENIPLELVAMPDLHNLAIKTPCVGYTLRNLPDGEVVTAVVYDDLGYVISYSKLLVKNTAFIRTTEANKKYVTSIHLESPFLSAEDDRLLQFPTNLPAMDVPATGVVTYSDGTVARYPAQGGRFRLYGLDHFLSTIVGQKIPLVLTYQLESDEQCYGASPGYLMHLSEKYWGTTTEYETAYSIKLYAYPHWVDDLRGYAMEFWLYTLDRCKVYPATAQVRLANNSPNFNPMQYGVRQQLTYLVDMQAISPHYPPYRHVQTFEVTLLAPGTDRNDKWLMGFSPNQSPPYGQGLHANIHFVNADHHILNLANGLHSQEEWLRHLFYQGEPLFNTHTEERAIPPNYAVIKFKHRSYEIACIDWDKDLIVVNDLAPGENLRIEFIHRRYENDLQLGLAALPVRMI
jgi:hypothetical protein